MYLEVGIGWIGRHWWSELKDILRGTNEANLNFHFKAMMKWLQKYTARIVSCRCWDCNLSSRWSKQNDTLPDYDNVNSVLHLGLVIELLQWCTVNLLLSMYKVACIECDRVNLKIFVETFIQQVCKCTLCAVIRWNWNCTDRWLWLFSR